MFGIRHCEPSQWAGGRRWRRHFGGGIGGQHGMGGGDMMRAGRMLATGDLRLIALGLIAEQPRHGYEIIKVLEDKTAGWYSPSPGVVYPTLTFLEEAGYVTGQTEGAKKLYTITAEGRAHLEENRDFVDAVLKKMAALGERVTSMRRRFGRGDDADEHPRASPLVRAAFDNLRTAAMRRIEDDADAEAKVVEVLARAAQEIRKS